MKLFRALALVCAIALTVGRHASGQNAALMPVPRMQFFSANGVPLAGGFIWTCVSGTSCPGNPLATYTDSTGSTPNANPIVLDAGGFAGIWLSGSSYKIVAQDLNGVTQWTVDNVSAPGFCIFSGVCSFSSLTVTGNATIGGTLSVTGTTTLAGLSASSAAISGNETVGGTLLVGSTLSVSGASFLNALAATTGAFSGNETVGGTLGVTGPATFIGGIAGPLAIAGNTAIAGTLSTTGTATVGGASLLFTAGATTHIAAGYQNSDLAGFLTLTGGTATYTFTGGPYLHQPFCVGSDSSASLAANPVNVYATTTTLKITGTSGDSADYVCIVQN